MVSEYDLVVVGAGPAGESAAQMAANLGYAVAVVERDTVGGTVVTNGGAPTKTFREAALYLSAFEKEKLYGVSLAAAPEVMYPAMTARARAVSEAMRQASLDRLQGLGVQLVYGAARLEDAHTVIARSSAGGETRLRGERVVLATGSRPLRPASVPFEDPWVFDSEEIMELGQRPSDILIVGGGPVGVEYATIFSALGVPVTILDGAPRLLMMMMMMMMMDEEISQRLESVFLERGIRVITGTGMASVTRDGNNLRTVLGDGRELRPTALLFAAGRSVDTADLGLDTAGIAIDGRGRIIVDERGQTSCPTVSPRATSGARPWPRWPSTRADRPSAGRSTWTSRCTWISSRSAPSTACPRSRARA